MSESENKKQRQTEVLLPSPEEFIKRHFIKTERLFLMPLGPKFLESAWEYYGDDENCRLMLYFHDNKKEEIAKLMEFVENDWFREDEETSFCFAVTLNETGKHIGEVSITIHDWEQVELSWIFAREFQNKGYCTEAAKAVIKWREQFSHVSAIMARCNSQNAASKRVMEKLGLSPWYSYKELDLKSGEKRQEDTFLLTLGEKTYEEAVN